MIEGDKKNTFVWYCLALFLIAFIWAAINPYDRMDWALESILSIVFVAALLFTYNKFRLSNLSYGLITLFLLLHTIGSHYTYANVPILNWLWEMLGTNRNHYDRIVHFSFGLLLSYPIREVCIRITNVRGFWAYYLPFDVTASFSAVYEIIEWLTAQTVSPDLGMAYLGTQGDIWDAQKDMAMAIIGSVLAMVIIAIVNIKYNKNFGKEMKESFAVKEEEPLGEVKLKELKAEKTAEININLTK